MVLLAVMAAVLVAQTGAAPTPGDMGRSVAPLVDRVKDSVVTIRSTKVIRRMVREDPFTQMFRQQMGMAAPRPPAPETQQGLGSGFLVDARGIILTNNHVVAGADDVQVVLGDSRVLAATVVGTDRSTDVAVIKLLKPPRDLKAVTLGDSDAVRVGDYVLAIGNPLGLGQTVTMGIISAKNRSLPENLIDLEDFFQTDAAINQGNSGGPLFNFYGQVIGINSAILNPAMAMNVGFAIPINLAQRIAQQIQQTGHVAHGYLGVRSADFTPDDAKQLGVPFEPGTIITDVPARTPAAVAGLRTNDVLLEIGGRRIEGQASMKQAIAMRRAGDKVKIVASRAGRRFETQAVLTENENYSNDSATLLGLRVQKLSERDLAAMGIRAGVRVTGVDPRSAASGSLQEDDIIVAVDRQFATVDVLRALEKRLQKGGSAQLVIQRGPDQYVLTLR